MPKIMELSPHDVTVVAGGEQCIDSDPGPVSPAEMIQRMLEQALQGVTAPLN